MFTETPLAVPHSFGECANSVAPPSVILDESLTHAGEDDHSGRHNDENYQTDEGDHTGVGVSGILASQVSQVQNTCEPQININFNPSPDEGAEEEELDAVVDEIGTPLLELLFSTQLLTYIINLLRVSDLLFWV